MVSKLKGIIAYGRPEDREKLAVLAQLANQSASEWIIARIRENYAAAFGETDPKLLNLPN
jgi:hypothetical protein